MCVFYYCKILVHLKEPPISEDHPLGGPRSPQCDVDG